MTVRRSPVHSRHERDAGSFGEYFGWQVPAVYTSVDDEFDSATQRVGIVDHSMFGRIEAEGSDALDLLHRLSTNDLLKLRGNALATTVLTTDKGRIVDLATVIAGESKLHLIVSPDHEEAVINWVDKYTITEQVSMRSVTADSAMFSLVGPHALALAEAVLGGPIQTNATLRALKPYGQVNCISVSTGREQAVRLITECAHANALWDEVVDAGRQWGLARMGFLAYEAFRIARAIPGFGTELSEQFNPLEVGLNDAVSFTKGCYIGQEVIARLDTYQKVRRTMVNVVLSGKPTVPGEIRRESESLGTLTSCTTVPVHGKYIGLALVSRQGTREGDAVEAGGERDRVHGTVISTPVLFQS